MIGLPLQSHEVRALLATGKVTARRVCKDVTEWANTCAETRGPCRFKRVDDRGYWFICGDDGEASSGWSEMVSRSPFSVPGERRFVKETFHRFKSKAMAEGYGAPVVYRADNPGVTGIFRMIDFKWTPSIHCREDDSRLTIVNVATRVEKVWEIGQDGRIAKHVLAAGIMRTAIDREEEWFHQDDAPALAFSRLWGSTHRKPEHQWAANPWVFVGEFEKEDAT